MPGQSKSKEALIVNKKQENSYNEYENVDNRLFNTFKNIDAFYNPRATMLRGNGLQEQSE